jgi:hypothetical protein
MLSLLLAAVCCNNTLQSAASKTRLFASRRRSLAHLRPAHGIGGIGGIGGSGSVPGMEDLTDVEQCILSCIDGRVRRRCCRAACQGRT